MDCLSKARRTLGPESSRQAGEKGTFLAPGSVECTYTATAFVSPFFLPCVLVDVIWSPQGDLVNTQDRKKRENQTVSEKKYAA